MGGWVECVAGWFRGSLAEASTLSTLFGSLSALSLCLTFRAPPCYILALVVVVVVVAAAAATAAVVVVVVGSLEWDVVGGEVRAAGSCCWHCAAAADG